MLVKLKYEEFEIEINVFLNGDPIGGTIQSTGSFYEAPFLTWVKENYPVQAKILDIGANIGNHSIFFSNMLKNTGVYAFEPEPENLKYLKLNVQGMDVTVCDYALSDEEGTAELYNTQSFNHGGFTMESAKFSQHNPISINHKTRKVTLDSLNLNDISLIKIDVENHELKVLEGGRDTIIRNKPLIFIENLAHRHPNVCPPNKYDEFFHSVEYTLKESNIHGGLMDLWIPGDKI